MSAAPLGLGGAPAPGMRTHGAREERMWHRSQPLTCSVKNGMNLTFSGKISQDQFDRKSERSDISAGREHEKQCSWQMRKHRERFQKPSRLEVVIGPQGPPAGRGRVAGRAVSGGCALSVLGGGRDVGAASWVSPGRPFFAPTSQATYCPAQLRCF